MVLMSAGALVSAPEAILDATHGWDVLGERYAAALQLAFQCIPNLSRPVCNLPSSVTDQEWFAVTELLFKLEWKMHFLFGISLCSLSPTGGY